MPGPEDPSVSYSIRDLFHEINTKLAEITSKLDVKADKDAVERVASRLLDVEKDLLAAKAERQEGISRIAGRRFWYAIIIPGMIAALAAAATFIQALVVKH